MPDALPPSEFGGKVRKNRTQPFPHEPTASERLMLTYTTGDPSGVFDPDQGEAFSGLSPYEVQLQKRLLAGDMDKGQVWEEFQSMPQPSVEVDPTQ